MTKIHDSIAAINKVGCLYTSWNLPERSTKSFFLDKARIITDLSELVLSDNQGTAPDQAYRYKSSRLDVFQVNNSNRWDLHWDEKFFDYIEYFLYDCFTISDSNLAIRLTLFKMVCVVSEHHCLRDTHFASAAMAYGQNSIRLTPDKRVIDLDIKHRVTWVYALIRQLVYLHEQAHFDIKFKPEIRDEANIRINTVIKKLKSGGYSARQFQNTDGFHGNEIAEAMKPSVADMLKYIQDTQDGESANEELIIDFLAFKNLFSYETHFRKSFANLTEETALAQIYCSAMIWHYVSATFYDVRTHINRKNSINDSKHIFDESWKIYSGHARNNMRGFLIQELIMQNIADKQLDGTQYLVEALWAKEKILKPFYSLHTVSFKELLALDWYNIAESKFHPDLNRKAMIDMMRPTLLYT